MCNAGVQETAAQRAAEWRAVGPAAGLVDRRVEITGPSSDRKMVINALNSGATQYMADFEDATTPTWENMLRGQINVRDSNDRTIAFESPDGKKYKLNDKVLPPRHHEHHTCSAPLFALILVRVSVLPECRSSFTRSGRCRWPFLTTLKFGISL